MTTEQLKQTYADYCNAYLKKFCDLMDFSYEQDAWVAGQPGTVAAVTDYFFDFHDVIKFCVDNNLNDQNEIIEWYDYTLWANDLNQPVPNFQSWHKGCPRTSKEMQEKLSTMKRELIKLCEEEKKNPGNVIF